VGPDGVERTRNGTLVSLRVEPYERGVVLPHERTHAGPKEGRLRLLRALRTQLEPIFLLHEGDPVELPDREPDLEVGGDRLWRVDEGPDVADRQLLIADGHHRYETTLAYHAEEGTEASAWMMVVLVSTREEGLTIFPTHRLAERVGDVDGNRLAGVDDALGRLEAAPGDRAAAVLYRGADVRLLLGEEGELDTAFVERLAPGRHAYWSVERKVEVKRLDLRPQAIEITAQEMLTKDRIALRVTLTAFRRIVDPERAVGAVADVDAWLYRLVQFAIREAVAARTLDEVLAAKNALDAELRAFVRERLAETGIEVTELGVKDVILPGEIRELVNKVVEAERTAKANLIRRQEETAATRSLLNTAKLMEENPLLLRLKELESLERLVEKVGRIDLHAGEGQGLDALLTKLVRLKAPESA
jgi:regulator of protease activity HflC (stomatin/prohibitin superfamily)